MARRLVMWAAGVVLAMSVAAWGVSLQGVIWESDDSTLFLIRGETIFSQGMGDGTGWRTAGFEWPKWRWAYGDHLLGFYDRMDWLGMAIIDWQVIIPLWIPGAGAGLILAVAWFVGRTGRMRTRTGHCPCCAYDLTGITGPCPECGKERGP